MSKSDLKAAMQSLQVNKPLRLPAKAPSFTPPEAAPLVEKPTQVENSTLVDSHTEAVKSTVAQPTTQAAIAPEVQKQTEVELPTTVESPSLAQETAVVEKQTSVGNKTEVASSTSPRRATEQDSSVLLEERAIEGLEKGYTRLPNTTLMRLASGDFTKNEIKLALLIARFTISFQRKRAPLSKSVLERRSGLRGAAVLEALSGLCQKGLIEKIQGDENRPNQLGLVLPPEWDQLINPNRDGNTTPVEKVPEVTNTTLVKKMIPAEVQKSTEAGVGNQTYFKDKENIENKLSPSLLPEILSKYFAELKPAKKRESELSYFQNLQNEFPDVDIADCLAFVQKHGVGRGENVQPCHSPMAYLSKAIAEIMPEIEKLRKARYERIAREKRETESKQMRAAVEEREAAEWTIREEAFTRAFSSEEKQTEVIHKYLQTLPFKPNDRIARMVAIDSWWEELNAREPRSTNSN